MRTWYGVHPSMPNEGAGVPLNIRIPSNQNSDLPALGAVPCTKEPVLLLLLTVERKL
jgi:hypothetical protein